MLRAAQEEPVVPMEIESVPEWEDSGMDLVEQDRLQRVSALQKAAASQDDGHLTPTLLGMVLGAVFLGEAIGTLGLGVLYAPIAMWLWKSWRKKGQSAVYIRESDVFAHRLDRVQLKRLAALTSRERVEAQLIQANMEGQELSEDAEKILRKIDKYTEIRKEEASWDDKDIKELRRVYREADMYSDTSYDDYEPIAPIRSLPGSYTKLTALDIPSLPVTTPADPSSPKVAAAAKSPKSEQHVKPDTALDMLLKTAFKTTAFFGYQRSGKSMLVALICQFLAMSGVKIYHINLLSVTKDGENEDDLYSRSYFKSITGNITKKDQNAPRLISQASQLIEDWWEDQGPSILVVDEWAYLSSEYACSGIDYIVKTVSGYIAALSSSGIKQRKAVYTILSTMVAGDMIKAGKAIKTSRACYVTVPPGQFIDWKGTKIGFDDELYKQVKINFPGLIEPPMPISVARYERVAAIEGKWLDLGTHPDMFIKDNPVLHGEEMDEEIEELDSGIQCPIADGDRISRKVCGFLRRKGSQPSYKLKASIFEMRTLTKEQLSEFLFWMQMEGHIEEDPNTDNEQWRCADQDNLSS